MSTYRHYLSGAVTILVVLVLTACSAVKDYQEKDDFNKKTEDFVLRLKWSDFVGVSLHFEDDLREDFLERFDEWDTMKISEVIMSRTKSEMDGDVERKLSDYKIEYYLLNEMKVHKEKIRIVWELAPADRDKGSYWRIVEPFPKLEVEKK